MYTGINKSDIVDQDDGKVRFIGDLHRRLVLFKILFLESAIFKSSYFLSTIANARQNAKTNTKLESGKER
jgi:hypothetical protein